jgi:hypothetical protein
MVAVEQDQGRHAMPASSTTSRVSRETNPQDLPGFPASCGFFVRVKVTHAFPYQPLA